MTGPPSAEYREVRIKNREAILEKRRKQKKWQKQNLVPTTVQGLRGRLPPGYLHVQLML